MMLSSLVPRNRMVMQAGAILLAILLALGLYWRHRMAEQRYLRNYVLALYGIKTGFDRGQMIGDKYADEWRFNIAHALAAPTMDVEQLDELKIVTHEVDQLMATVDDPPQELRGAAEQLRQLYAAYGRQNAMVLSPPNITQAAYSQELETVQADFQNTLETLKYTIPPLLRPEIGKASAKYDLRFLRTSK